MSKAGICPVCRWPGHSGAPRGQCDWEDPGASGSGTNDLEQQGRLAAWQRDYDLHAAARAASITWPVDRLLLGALAATVRGGPVRHGQIEQTMTAPAQPAVTSAGMSFALARLISGKTSAIAFVEIGPDAVSRQTLTADERGVPVQLAGESYPWTMLLPELPVHIGLRYLRMAGGAGVPSPESGEADPAALSAAAAGYAKPVFERFAAAAGAPSRRVDTVLVLRAHDWPPLDAAAAQARTVLRPVTEVTASPTCGALADVVDVLAAQAPLRDGYDLILVETGPPAGRVRLRSYELFSPGAAALPGPLPVTAVEVAPVPGHAADHLVLPIVARRGPVADLRDVAAVQAGWPLVSMPRLDATAGGPFRVRVELNGPWRVQPLPLPGLLRGGAGSADWPGLIGDLPERLRGDPQLPPGGLDLVLLVELGAATGAEEAVAARVELSKRVVREFRQVPEARVAVLGYRDHFNHHIRKNIGKPGREGEALVVGSTGGFSPPDDLKAIFRRPGWWNAVPVGHDHAAPVEEALWLLAEDTWEWRSAARHIVLIIGRRPPHPMVQRGGVVLPCWNHLSWRKALERLREQAVECLAVLDSDPEPGYAANTWMTLTAPVGYRTARGTTAHALARDCGLIPGPRARLALATLAGGKSLPMAGQEGAR